MRASSGVFVQAIVIRVHLELAQLPPIHAAAQAPWRQQASERGLTPTLALSLGPADLALDGNPTRVT